MSAAPVLDAALGYAKRGWPCFPVAGKRPHPRGAPHGLYDATTNTLTISRLFEWYPKCGVAIRAGAESGLVVVDLDGEAGVETARELGRRHGGWPATLWAITGSGGYHGYFAHPDGTVPNSVGRVGPGVDVRGDGGYVVAPPSPHPSGGTYRWWNPDREPAPLPAWLREAMTRPQQPPPMPARIDRGRVDQYAAAALAGEHRAVATAVKPHRNEQLNRSAFRLGTLIGAAQLAEAQAVDRLEHACLLNGLWEDPDDGPATCRKTIASGLRAGMAHPREIAS